MADGKLGYKAKRQAIMDTDLPLFDVPLSQQIMRLSEAVPPASFAQTASG